MKEKIADVSWRKDLKIVKKESDVVWADVRNLFQIQTRNQLWWPGRVCLPKLVFPSC